MKESRSFLYVEIAEALRRRIAFGDPEPGDRLPPIRRLAGAGGVGGGHRRRADAERPAVGRRRAGRRLSATAQAGSTTVARMTFCYGGGSGATGLALLLIEGANF